jgi:hypothetical protein
MARARTTLLALALVAASPPAVAQNLDCPDDVCWEARLTRADGAPLAGGDAPTVVLGEVLVLTVDVLAPRDAGVFVPTNPALGPWRLVRAASPELPEPPGEGKKLRRRTLEIRALRMGAKAIPPIEVTWRLADGTTGSFETERELVRVRGRLDNEQDPALSAAPSPVPVVATNWLLVGLATLLCGGLVTLLLLPLIRRLRGGAEQAEPPPPPRPANEVALEALAWIEGADLTAEERYALAVDALRAYLGGRYGFDAMESTTAELMAELEPLSVDGVGLPEIQAILDDADLVKFAKLIPTQDEALTLVARAREIVLSTWVEPEHEPAPEPDSDSDPDPDSRPPTLVPGQAGHEGDRSGPDGPKAAALAAGPHRVRPPDPRASTPDPDSQPPTPDPASPTEEVQQ